MARKSRINWIFLSVFLIGFIALAATVLGLRAWNRTHRASVGLREGTQAYENRQWRQAAVSLGQYISLNQRDVEILMKYAHALLQIRPLGPDQVRQAIRSYQQILRIEDHPQACTKLVDLYLQIGDAAEAEKIARDFLEKTYDRQVSHLLGQALLRQREMEKACRHLEQQVRQDPGDVNSYNTLMVIGKQAPEISSKTPEQWLEEALEKNPDQPQAWLLKAGYNLSIGRTEEARKALIRAEQDPIELPEDHLGMAYAWIQCSDLKKARSHLDNALEIDPHSLPLWLLYAEWALVEGSEPVLIQTAADGIETLEPEPFEFLPIAAKLYIAARQWDQAGQVLDRLKNKQADSNQVAALEGQLADAREDWKTSVQCWRKVVDSSQRTEESQLKLARALEELGDRIAAIQELRNLLGMNPRQDQAHSHLARLLAASGRWSQAVEHAQQAVQLKPANPAYQIQHLNYQLLWNMAEPGSLDSEQIRKVEQELVRLNQDSEDPGSILLMLRSKLGQGRVDEVAGQLPELHERFGDRPEFYMLEANLHLFRNQRQRAHEVLDTAIAKFPDQPEPIRQKCLLLKEEKKYAESIGLLDRLIEKQGASDEMKQVALMRAECVLLDGRREEAIERLEQMIVQYPDDLSLKRRRLEWARKTASVETLQSWIDELRETEGSQGRQWRYEQARLWLERSGNQPNYPRIISLLTELLRDYPDDQSSRLLLAACHEASGHLQLAVTIYKEALSRDPDNLDLVVTTVSAMNRNGDFQQAEEILQRISRQGMKDSRLSRLELGGFLRQGKLDTATDLLEEILKEAPQDREAKLTLAMVSANLNDLEIAERLLDELLASDPDFFAAYSARADLYLKQNQTDQALEFCDQAVQRFDDSRSYALRAMVLARAGYAERASEDVERFLEKENQSVSSLLQACGLYLSIGDHDTARMQLTRALELEPDNFDVLKQAATVFSQFPDQESRTETYLQKALQQQPEDPDLRVLQARRLLAEGSPSSIAEARKNLNQVILDNPQKELAWLMLAEWNFQQDDAGQAMDLVLRGLRYHPDSKPLLMLKARLEARQSDALALPTLSLLQKRYPQDAQISSAVAEARIRMGQPQAAVELMEKMLSQSVKPADQPLLEQTLMVACYANGQDSRADALFDKLVRQAKQVNPALRRWILWMIENNRWDPLADELVKLAEQAPQEVPEITELFLTMAMKDTHQGLQAAQVSLERLYQLYPRQVHVMTALGRLYHYQGKSRQAADFYEQVLRLDPHQIVALNNLAWILANDQKQYDRALQLANQGLEIQPENLDLLDTRGEICFLSGNYEQAEKDLERCVQMYPADSEKRVGSGYRLTKTLFQLGQKARALEMARQVEQWNQRSQALSTAELNELQRIREQLQSL